MRKNGVNGADVLNRKQFILLIVLVFIIQSQSVHHMSALQFLISNILLNSSCILAEFYSLKSMHDPQLLLNLCHLVF